MSARKAWLPREGFHADVVGQVLRNTVLNPKLLASLILLLKYTLKGQIIAERHPKLFSLTKILAILGAIRIVNAKLNHAVLNNGVKDSYKWDKEIVLITGGSDGIGKAITLMLAAKRVKVVVLDVQPLKYIPPSCVKFFSCDITSSDAITATASEIRSSIGEPTVLINNAGVCRGKPILDNTDFDLDLTFNVNTISHYKLAREFLPDMIKNNHGTVVTVASSAAWVTAPRMTEYAASKAAALAFHEGLSAELITSYNAPRVRTIVVNQGYTKTSLFQGFGVKDNQFFGPALYTDTLAEAIVEQLYKGESGQLILPGFYKLLAANFRSLPLWLQYRGRAQLNDLMKNWKGRQVTEASN